MSVKKDIKKILEILEPFEKDIILKAQKYVELKAQIETVKFNVKSVKHFIDEKGDYAVRVEYDFPPLIITEDRERNLVCDEMFKNINLLNLIPFEDMEKIKRAIDYMQEKNKR